jgi:hypothetical protein
VVAVFGRIPADLFGRVCNDVQTHPRLTFEGRSKCKDMSVAQWFFN